jgi:hypothetical protein
MSNYAINKFYTTDLVLNVMANCARRLDLDIDDNDVADRLYQVCCSLESHDPDHGFGSSDMWCYVGYAEKEFGIEAPA